MGFIVLLSNRASLVPGKELLSGSPFKKIHQRSRPRGQVRETFKGQVRERFRKQSQGANSKATKGPKTDNACFS